MLALVGAAAGASVRFDAWNLIRPVTLTGFSSEDLTGEALRIAVSALGVSLLNGALRPPRHEILPLSQVAEAHRRLESGDVRGRVLLQPEANGG